MSDARAVHFRTCNLCEAMCGLAIEHDGDRVLDVRGDELDPFSRGHICPKAVALVDVHEDPDRLRLPQRRVGDGWEACEWDAALRECAERLVDIQRRHGRDSVALYIGNPTVHNLGAMLYGVWLLKTLGTRNRYSATSVDQLPHMLVGLLMFGHQVLMPVPDLDHTRYLLMLGANPLVSNGSLMTAPGVKRRLQELRRRGGRLVVIDPRFTETAAIADRHCYIKPGSDALLLAAMIQVIFAEKLARPGRLSAFTDGLDALERVVAPFTPEAVAPRTGLDAALIRALAREFAAAERAVCYGRVGVCTQAFGGLAIWLVTALNLITGNLDRPGGYMFTRPAADVVASAARIGMTGHFDKGRSRVRGLPEFGGEYPVSTLAEEIETEGEGRIRALVTIAGNPVLSAPNGARIERALGKLDFMVSLDIYRNETTRHASFILPPSSQLEQSHYDLALHAVAVRNTAKYSPPLFRKPAGTKDDWEIQIELAQRIERARGGFSGMRRALFYQGLRRLRPEGLLDAALRFGPYGGGLVGSGLRLKTLRAAPHGIDLGALEPCLPARLYTPNKRICLVPAAFARDLARLERELHAANGAGLLLIGRRQLRTNNSWLHNSLRMVKGRDRCTLLMHPSDALTRGLSEGQRVRLRSRAGAVEIPLQLTDRIMPGVVSLPHGFGHARPGMALRIASAHAGASINDVTDELLVDELSGTAVLNGVPVDVEPA